MPGVRGCAKECPTLSMALLGESWGAADLVDELAKDQAYFLTSGGGITLSGGEATLQHPFTHAVLKMLQERKIHTALDTCGLCSFEILEKLLPQTNLLLFDLKEMDDKRHESFTGVSNGKILENLERLPDLLKATQTDLWIRTPIIPDTTDQADNILKIGEFIAGLKGRVARWELCAFNNLGKEKYARLGKDWAYKNTLLMEREKMETLYHVARGSGVDEDIVFWTGSVRS
jgi:pyruvate formate lyase activating enzyme